MDLQPIKINSRNSRRRNGGDDDGFFAAAFKKWANYILNTKVAPLDELSARGAYMEPEQVQLREKLHNEFDRVAKSVEAAKRVIREYSIVPVIPSLI